MHGNNAYRRVEVQDCEWLSEPPSLQSVEHSKHIPRPPGFLLQLGGKPAACHGHRLQRKLRLKLQLLAREVWDCTAAGSKCTILTSTSYFAMDFLQ